MAKNKIYLNHTLIEYNKKYGNKNYKKINKVDADKNPTLLKDKSWWLIKDTYYEVPNKKGIGNWWSNLGKGGKIAVCALAGVAVATAVIVPTVIAVTNKQQTIDRTIDFTGGDLKDVTPKKDGDNISFDLTCSDDTHEITAVSKVMIGNVILDPSDYTFDKENHKLIILKSGLDKAAENDNITIELIERKKGETVYVTDISCNDVMEATVGDVISFHDLGVVITPSDATNKTYRVEEGGSVNSGCLEIDNEAQTITAVKAGEEGIYVVANGMDPEGGGPVMHQCVFDIQNKETKVESVEITNTTTEVNVGSELELTAKVLPDEATNPKLSWEIVDGETEKAEIVEKNNKVYLKGKTVSKVSVKATSMDGSCKSDTKEFTVKAAVTYKINWYTKAIGDPGETPEILYKRCTAASKIIFGQTSKYSSEIQSLNKYNVGEGDNDLVYAYFDKSDNPVIYILSDGAIKFNDNDLVEGSHGFFAGCSNATEIILENIDTSEVSTMIGLFALCKSLKSIDLSYLNTSNATDMSAMFSGCASLDSIDLSCLDTKKVKNMSDMFSVNEGVMMQSKLKTINFGSNFNTSNVLDMSNMFQKCISLISLDLSMFDTSSVTNMGYMFNDCSSLSSLKGLTNFNTSNVLTMESMFKSVDVLTSLDLSSFNTNKVTSTERMFADDKKLITIIASNDFGIDNITNSSDMFSSCTALVGGNGTTYNKDYSNDKDYAHIDGVGGKPGYFTAK